MHEAHKFEIRTGDQLLLGNTCECVTLAEISTARTVELILQSTLCLQRAIRQQRLIEQCCTPAKASEAAKTQIIKPVETRQNRLKTPVSVG